jgi:dipeptidyl aminopeptidase/acylaminoacyl peptidase
MHSNQTNQSEWEKRFRINENLMVQVARSNKSRGLVSSNRTGVLQLHAWNVRTGEFQQLTHFPTGKSMGKISPDGRYVYFLKDQGGNEIGHFVRIPWAGGEMEDISPDLPPFASYTLDFSADGRKLVFMAAGQDGFRIFVMNLGPTGELSQPRLIYKGAHVIRALSVSHDGGLAAFETSEMSKKLQMNLVVLDTDTGNKVAELWDGPETSMGLSEFAPCPGDSRLMVTSNKTGVARPQLWNPRTGERLDLAIGDMKGEFEARRWSPDAKNILLQQVFCAEQQFFIYNLDKNKLSRLEHPSGTYMAFGGAGTFYYTNDEIFAQWQDSTHPTQTLCLDAHTGAVKRVVLSSEDVPACIPWRSVSFPSSDGMEIQAWLATPRGEGPFPAILDIHGGPSAATTDSFNPWSQAWLDHGFAFLSINYHGSTTFGKEFQDKIIGNLGYWETEDVKVAHKFLVDNKIADPKRIFVTGWSYGGYMTLMSVGKLPDLWAGGMAGIAIADWGLMYEDQAPTLRGMQVALFGGTPKEKPEQHRLSSPITYAENVKVPLLIIQGSNDTRCPAHQMQVYLDKMKAMGKNVKVEWFEAGHGSMDREKSIHHMEIMLGFAENIINK